MAYKSVDRCKETTSTTGTGNLTLTGAQPGSVAMSDATAGLTSNGDTGCFCAENGTEWEIFLGTRISSTVLERTTVLSSSNAGAAVNFTAAPMVFSTVPARQFNAPAFSAHRATTTQSLTASAYTKVELNTLDFDEGSCFDVGNFRWTPTVPGYYHVSFAVGGATSSGTMTFTQALLRRNGTTVANGVYAQAIPNNMNSAGAKLVYMNGSTDYLELFVIANGSTPYVNIGAAHTFMTGHFVRPA